MNESNVRQIGKPQSPDEAARDRHFRAAAAIENDAQILKDYGIGLRKLIDDGLAQVTAQMKAARAAAELKCEETKDALVKAADAHVGACAAYLALCEHQGDVFRADGDKMLDVIKRAEAKLDAKTQAILSAGEKPEEPESAAPQPGPAPANDAAGQEEAAA